MANANTLTIELTKEDAERALADLLDLQPKIETELQRVKNNIASVRAFLGLATRSTVVRSQTQPGVTYTVTRTGQELSCTCMSFRYKSGIDDRGNCKHINQAVREWRI